MVARIHGLSVCQLQVFRSAAVVPNDMYRPSIPAARMVLQTCLLHDFAGSQQQLTHASTSARKTACQNGTYRRFQRLTCLLRKLI